MGDVYDEEELRKKLKEELGLKDEIRKRLEEFADVHEDSDIKVTEKKAKEEKNG